MTKKINLFIIFSFLFFTSLKSSFAATFSFSPSSGTYNKDCTYSVDVALDAQGSPTNAADIIIDYDSSKIEILDSDTGTSGVQIGTGTVYSNYFGNQVQSNVIRLTGASFVGTFTGSGTFATIRFKPRTSNTTANFTIRFTGADPYNTHDSNIADANTSNDLLTSVTNASYTFGSGSCTADRTSPTITFVSPTNGQRNVPATSNIIVRVADAGVGVDINSVQIIINGVTYRSNSQGVTYSGSPASYTFTVDPADPIYTNQANTVRVVASDQAGNSKEDTITFNIPAQPTTSVIPTPTTSLIPTPTPIVGGTCPAVAACPICPTGVIIVTPTPTLSVFRDANSPVIEFIKPQAKDIVDLKPSLDFRVSDSDSGININTLKIELNGLLLTSDNPNVIVTGDKNNYLINAKILSELIPNNIYTLTVFVADYNNNGVSQSISFQTISPPSSANVSILDNLNPFKPKTPSSPSTGSTTYSFANTLRATGNVFLTLLFILLILGLIYWLYRLFKRLSITEGRPLGIVYNSLTHEPLSNIKISVLDSRDQKVAQLKTNVYGIFASTLPDGKYRFTIAHPEYAFPALDGQHQLDYPSVYNGREVAINPDTYLSIPIKPLFPAYESSLPVFLQSLLMFFGYSLPPYGRVLSGGQPQKGVRLGLKETKFDSLITTRITDELGRYRFLVSPGRYQVVLLTKKDIPLFTVDTRHHLTGPTVINKDIAVKVTK